MYSKQKAKIVREWGELEADAQHEINLAHQAKTKEEENEHYINAIIAENAATYLHDNYGRAI